MFSRSFSFTLKVCALLVLPVLIAAFVLLAAPAGFGPEPAEAANVALLLGIIYARDLRRYEMADKHLTRSMAALRDQPRREQCAQWLRDVRATLGRSAPEPDL